MFKKKYWISFLAIICLIGTVQILLSDISLTDIPTEAAFPYFKTRIQSQNNALIEGQFTNTIARTFGSVTTTGTVTTVRIKYTSATIANVAGIHTQTVAVSYYLLAPSAINTQRLYDATEGDVVYFLNIAATNVVFLDGDSNLDLGGSDITLGLTDVLALIGQGTNWFRLYNTDN